MQVPAIIQMKHQAAKALDMLNELLVLSSETTAVFVVLVYLQAIGFDMDYTLAQYKPDTFEELAHQQTVDKLVTAFGYPAELYDFKFDWRYMMRGLIMDKVGCSVVDCMSCRLKPADTLQSMNDLLLCTLLHHTHLHVVVVSMDTCRDASK